MHLPNKKNLNQTNIIKWMPFVLLLLILCLITLYRVKIQIDIGAPYDTYDFLANAADFAGKSIGYTDIRPPFLSFLTSIIFRFDGLSVQPIFYIDAMLDVIGAVGLYLLFRLRFNNLNSFLGSLLFFTFPIVLTYVGVGYPDLPSVSIGIWALYLTVLGVKQDSKFFLLSFPVAMLAFLTRYNMALIIFPTLFYISINWQEIKKRNLITGMLISFLVIAPLLLYFNLKYGNPLSPFLEFFGTSSGSSSVQHFDYNPDILFYIKLFPFMIGNGAYFILLTIIGGILLAALRLIKGKIHIPKNKFNYKNNYKTKLIFLFLAVAFLASLGQVSYILSEIIFFFLILCSYKLLKFKYNRDLDFLFLSWFMTFLIFSSVFVIKDIRYFLAMMPPVSYFLIRGLVMVENQIGSIKKRKLTVYLAPLLILVLIVSTSFYLASIPEANNYSKSINNNMEEASSWLVNYDPEYKSKVIFSDLSPNSAWFLQMLIKKMPEFKDNKTYYTNIKDYQPTEQDSDEANKFLVENNAYYYFSIQDWVDLRNYSPIKKFGIITIFRRSS